MHQIFPFYLPNVISAENLLGKERRTKQLTEYSMVRAILKICMEF